VVNNPYETAGRLAFRAGERSVSAELPPQSFNTIVLTDVDKARREKRHNQVIDQHNAAYARLRKDKKAWKEELEERGFGKQR